MKILLFGICLITGLAALPATAQDFDFDAFVGTWEGRYTSETFGGSDFPLALDIQPNGFYTDTSGYFMPPYYYPDTQNCEFDAATNRVHFYYEVVEYTGNYLELHYNYWDDPEPHPQAGTIVLNRVGVAPVGDEELPDRTALLGNYPNPFNPSTSIEFTLPASGFVTLKIYDVRGREIETLAAGQLEEGAHNYRWNAAGQADGVYLYQLTTAQGTETRKMTLVK